ncbi:MAG: DNA polymerase III subunit alpha, partial [Muribaculaceae bacterium]|nr:DNA polymerase III subunit alpha [Muribaculaceae bacterium]
MTPFIHLHVHSQYSLLDGQASVSGIVDKAMADGMPGVALTDHGTMYGVKEFTNYIKKKNGKTKDAIKEAQKEADEARKNGDEAAAAEAQARAEALAKKIFKPIIGCEMYVAEKDLHDHVDKRDTGRHLIVLAKNEKGYHNLIKLVSQAWTEGFYSHPRTDKPTIAAHREGLIICSACLGGELPKLLTAGDDEGADRCVAWWKETFGDDYYIELQRHKATVPRANHEAYELQMRIEPKLIELARKYDVKLVATNDVHFTNEEDAEAHDRLICLSTNKFLDDPDRMLYSKQEWLKTQAEMNEVFADIPEALTNTLEILDKVEVYSIDHAPIMPNFAIPESFGTEEEYRSRITEQELFDEFTRDENGNVVLSQEAAEAKIKKLGGYDKLYRIKFEADYLRKLAYDGAAKRYGLPLSHEVDERINFELHIMKTMGFPGYFLIVEDFIRAGREQLGVKIGPGRGSAAGSVVAYCLGITQIDPLKYDLLFERFLNPDRISLPDIDIDFDDDGREDVLHYVTQKYGEEKVAHIITYGTMAAKSAIKDVARVIQLPLPESNRLAGMVPKRMPEVNGKELKPTLKNCYEYVDDFKNELSQGSALVKDTLRYALALEGNVRNTGVHACGVIICRDDVTDWVPVSTAVDKKDGKVLVTQYEGSVIEETGLIKMDFLGLKTLSIIKEAIANIKLTRGEDVDIDNIPLDDPKTYALYCAGRTIGTFQFESTGMQRYLRELQPSTFEDLIAMNALYRPGPMQYIPDFIARKHGRAPIVYDIPEMETYLKDTYGVTVYQEQVMLLSRLLAGFTRGQSDTLRKAMGKKLISKMEELREVFFKGGQERGHKVEVLAKIWEDWKQFASYAFNKSHATCYSWVAFQTAYLKANYPSEYMAAVLSRNLSDITKLVGFMDECKAMKIRVLGPDINESRISFSVNSSGDIRFGLMAIKGVGEGVAKAIIAERDANGPYSDIYDVVERVPSGAINRKALENLAL